MDTAETVVFETNHPYVTTRDAADQQMDGKAFIHMIERNYRFFNFAFACVLYNVWRLVDLLVKLALDGEYTSYSPRVDANQFLTVAKQCYGLDPPD